MAKNQEAQPGGVDAAAASGNSGTQRVQVGIRLQPATAAEQRLYANFTVAQGGQGAIFLDFGFVEPAALNSVIRAAQAGTQTPENIGGQLACRVALSADAAAQLAQQLLALLQPRRGTASPEAPKP